jgi:hypothetical protein
LHVLGKKRLLSAILVGKQRTKEISKDDLILLISLISFILHAQFSLHKELHEYIKNNEKNAS